MAGGSKEANRDLAAVALAAGKTAAEAAAAAGVAERTVKYWAADAAFRDRVSDLRREVVGRACGELSDAMSAAAKKLRELVGSSEDGIALRAASAVIGHTLKVTELLDLQRRVEKLEQALARADQRNRGSPGESRWQSE
jgi:hypothetical protein